MMRIEILVEEPSAEEALRHLLPKIVSDRSRIKIINMGSKHKLLSALPARLRAYRQRIDKGEQLRLVVLVDRDNEDCIHLKHKLERMAHEAGLHTKTAPDAHGSFTVLNRIVVEELESWFIGDPQALRKAFPSLSAINVKTRPFSNPDNGGSWENLHRFMKKHGLYRNCFPKIDAAQKIAPHMDIRNNRSASFRKFVSGMQEIFCRYPS